MPLTQQQRLIFARPSAEPTIHAPLLAPRRFSVWCGAKLSPARQTVTDLAQAALALLPPGSWDTVELLIKAGEGGTWQGSFDSHPLAPHSAADLQALIASASRSGVRISPYVVVRGRPEWRSQEQQLVRDCVRIAQRCVLNVEPGASYWNGSTDPAYIRQFLRDLIVPALSLEVCAIPRLAQVNELGGAASLQAWTDSQLVGSASWETYGVTAGVSGPTSLLVNEAIPRLDGWGVSPGAAYRIPVVQRSERLRWASEPWAAYGLQVWYLEGD
jgi:hypothetical protein